MRLATETQTVWVNASSKFFAMAIPSPTTDLLQGVKWGCASELFTPAFWKYQAVALSHHSNTRSFRIGETLEEEIAACLLGGYGMPAELGLAAFYRLRERGLISNSATQEELERALSEPFQINDRPRKYRFARQKSRYLARVLASISNVELPTCARKTRDLLTTFPGIGPKTASWVVRNYFSSNEVAILDIHIVRACVEMGVFDVRADPSKSYYSLEKRFLQFCDALREPASLIDALMWDYMRRVGIAPRNFSAA